MHRCKWTKLMTTEFQPQLCSRSWNTSDFSSVCWLFLCIFPNLVSSFMMCERWKKNSQQDVLSQGLISKRKKRSKVGPATFHWRKLQGSCQMSVCMLKHFHHPNGSLSPRSKQIISDPHFQQKPNLDTIQKKRSKKHTHRAQLHHCLCVWESCAHLCCWWGTAYLSTPSPLLPH